MSAGAALSLDSPGILPIQLFHAWPFQRPPELGLCQVPHETRWGWGLLPERSVHSIS